MLIFRIIGISLLVLSVLASIVILLLPLGILQPFSMFLQKPEASLWLLFTLGLTFGAILFAVGSENRSVGSLAKVCGSILLLLGLASAIEIFLINAHPPSAPIGASLWWLFVIYNLLGGSAVYVAEVVKRMERRDEEERAKSMERKAKVPRREEERRIVRFSVRR